MTAVAADVTGCILAGGRGRRMGGVAKPLLVIDGERIVDRLCRLVAPRVAELLVAVAEPGPLAELGLRPVFDRHPGAGPLAGLDAALTDHARPWLLAVAGDLPTVQPAVLDLLLAARGDDVDAVVARVGGYPEPLLALYGRAAGPVVAAALAAGRLRTSAILDRLRVRWLDEATVRAVDPTLASFANLNHPEQLPRSPHGR